MRKKRGLRAMLWRRLIVLGLLSSLLSSLLTGCHLFQVMDGPGMEYKGGDNVPAEDPNPNTPKTEIDKAQETDTIVTGNDAEGNGSGAAHTLPEYLLDCFGEPFS